MKFTHSYECSLSDYGTPISDPIWLADDWGHVTKDEPAAFQRLYPIKIWIDVSSPDISIPSEGYVFVKVTMSGYWSRGGEAFPSRNWIKVVRNWQDKEWDTIYFTSHYISSSRPMGRDLLVLDWEFEYYKNGNWYSGGSQTTFHRIFFPYANPSGTWGAMTSDVLWKQAINHAGVLFDLIGAETNDPDYAKNCMTQSLYYVSGTEYDGEHSHHTGLTDFNMKLFLTDFYSDPWADCRDTSSDLQACSRALGIDCYSRTIDPDKYDILLTQSIDAIGPTPEGEPEWKEYTWNYHQIAWSNVWDPCIRVNEPSPILPIDMGLSTYQGYLWDNRAYCYWYGGHWYCNAWNVGEPFTINIVQEGGGRP